MRNTIHSVTLSMLFFITMIPMAQMGYADDGETYSTTPNQGPDSQDPMQALATYLYNLGGDLGYNLKTAVDSPISTLLVNPPTLLQSIGVTALSTMFGSIPVNASPQDPSLLNFVPSNHPTYSAFNALANTTFMSYNSPTTSPAGANATSSPVTVSPLMDQQTYQSDPVSQFILNMMSTPNSSYCMDRTGKNWQNKNSQTIGDCDYLYSNKILNNVIGTLPETPFLTPNADNQVLNELNGNTLIAPLLYSTTANNTKTSENKTSPSNNNPGLTANNQVQQATNFIRYATGAVIPLATPSQVSYNNFLMTINSSASSRASKEAALAELDKYFASVREYAAKSSVAVGNLYYILSKRIPQTPSQNEPSANATSQALSEMSMATRRMYDPEAVSAEKPQWLAQINTASPATVQKEMAILLAEINYQLYLNRQQEERLLLTNSLLLIQSLKQGMPNLPNIESIANADKR